MSGKGSTHLRAYHQGQTLTPRQSIRAKCADCTCDYTDGREDCGIQGCPLYPFMPYGNAPRAKIRRRPKDGEGINARPGSFTPEKCVDKRANKARRADFRPAQDEEDE